MSNRRASRSTGFQPTPRFVSEANDAERSGRAVLVGFNPRPASSARRTVPSSGVASGCGEVSTHAPLRQRGEPCKPCWPIKGDRFQPTPRFVSEANPKKGPTITLMSLFQPTPRFVSEANTSRE